jgi:hypothetical protein
VQRLIWENVEEILKLQELRNEIKNYPIVSTTRVNTHNVHHMIKNPLHMVVPDVLEKLVLGFLWMFNANNTGDNVSVKGIGNMCYLICFIVNGCFAAVSCCTPLVTLG